MSLDFYIDDFIMTDKKLKEERQKLNDFLKLEWFYSKPMKYPQERTILKNNLKWRDVHGEFTERFGRVVRQQGPFFLLNVAVFTGFFRFRNRKFDFFSRYSVYSLVGSAVTSSLIFALRLNNITNKMKFKITDMMSETDIKVLKVLNDS